MYIEKIIGGREYTDSDIESKNKSDLTPLIKDRIPLPHNIDTHKGREYTDSDIESKWKSELTPLTKDRIPPPHTHRHTYTKEENIPTVI